jgi:hypothetical protein
VKLWSQTEPYLRRIADLDDITEAHLSAIQARPDTPDELSSAAIETWGRFRRGATMTPADRTQLEEIVIPNGLRPCFDVQNGDVASLPDPWTVLNAHKPFLRGCIAAVGRVNVPGHAFLQYAGTGFVVGDRLLLTNRHVAEVFCQAGATPVMFTPGISPSLDFKQEVGSDATLVVSLSKPLLILSDCDAALFQLTAMPQGIIPLKLASNPPGAIEDRLATVIGYPALESNVSTQEILQQIQIFRAVFDKKRLQPGRLIGLKQTSSYGVMVEALAHDCSTLGGNSGSAMVDVEAEQIVGLHFSGEYLVANYAVPTWNLAEHRSLRDEGVLFS